MVGFEEDQIPPPGYFGADESKSLPSFAEVLEKYHKAELGDVLTVPIEYITRTQKADSQINSSPKEIPVYYYHDNKEEGENKDKLIAIEEHHRLDTLKRRGWMFIRIKKSEDPSY